MLDSVEYSGEFFATCWEGDKKLWRERFSNGITAAALLNILDASFRTIPWYMSPITLVSDVSSADTMASHAGWTEVTTAYDESPRPAWSPPAASGGKLKNTTTVEFTFNASTVCDGLLLVSQSDKTDLTGGTLWCTGKFSTPRTFAAGQQLRVFYELTATAI